METKTTSWVQYDGTDEFPIQNIPFGACNVDGKTFCCSRISNFAINLALLEEKGLLTSEGFKPSSPVFSQSNLNGFLDLGKTAWKAVRASLINLLSDSSKKSEVEPALIPLEKVSMQMPVFVRDYTDFYSSKNHAFNMGSIIRGPDNALQPNWVHLPVGYHGRASTVVVSGTDVIRPRGQIKPPKQELPSFEAVKRMDFECEMGAIMGGSQPWGKPIKADDAENYLFGFVLLNDWSARDVQTWEYQPLGPFNSKNFASTISPWIITTEALEEFRVDLPAQDPQPLPYLTEKRHSSWNIPIDVLVKGEGQKEYTKLSTTNYKHMYWTVSQQIAHHTVTGCQLGSGDMFGSGTISGTDQSSLGCLFELTKGGKEKLSVGGDERIWLNDGDSVILSAKTSNGEYTIGFGDCEGTIKPANPEGDYY